MEIVLIVLVVGSSLHLGACAALAQAPIGDAYRRQLLKTLKALAVIGAFCFPLVVLYGLGFVLFLHFVVCAILISFFGMLVSALLRRMNERRKAPWVISYLTISVVANFWPLLGHVEPWDMDIMLTALSTTAVIVGFLGVAGGLVSREFWMADQLDERKSPPLQLSRVQS